MTQANQIDAHLRALQTRYAPQLVRAAELSSGLTRQSFVEAIAHIVDAGPYTQGVSRAHEFSARLGEMYGTPARGLYVPISAGVRDLVASSPSAGGVLAVAGNVGALQDAVRPYSAAIAAGAQILPGVTQGDVVIPRLDSGSTAAWVGEGEGGTTGDPSVGQGVTIKPRTIHAQTRYTRQLHNRVKLMETLQGAIFDDLFRSIWAEIDRVILSGSGVGEEPLGIVNNPTFHVEAAGVDGGAPDWPLLTEIEREFGVRHGLSNPTWVTNANVRKKLRNTRKQIDLDFCWSDENKLLGHRTEVTEHVPSNLTKGAGSALSALMLGDFSTILIPMWGPAAIDVVVNPYTLAKDGKIQLDAFCELGVGFRHASAFVLAKDLSTEV